MSEIVRSSTKVRLLTQSSGSMVGRIVGRGVVSITTTLCVGLMMNDGSMRRDCAVGGMNGVGAGAGEQDEQRCEPTDRNCIEGPVPGQVST